MSAATAGIALATLALLVAGSAVASTIVLGVAALAAGLLSVIQIRTSLHGAPPTEPVPAEPETDAQPGRPPSYVTGPYRPLHPPQPTRGGNTGGHFNPLRLFGPGGRVT